jgi:hypothetical protein
MFNTIIVLILVIGAVLGGLFALRRSGRAGMPDAEVMGRAAKRAREQQAADDRED